MKINCHSLSFLIISSFFISGSAYSAKNHEPGYAIQKSSQTFVLNKSSLLHDEWSSWIKRQNLGRRPLGGNDKVDYDVGVITIIVDLGGNSRNPSGIESASPPDNGPPSPLPSTGTPGQKITIINQTPSIYRRWTYVWTTTGGGGSEGGYSGWSEISYTGSVCSGPKGSGRLCTPDTGGGE